MIGPTGVGKTEIARRLARLAQSPFLKVEATKFTEVGYVGRDVDQIVRDLVENALAMVRDRRRSAVRARADAAAEERLLAALVGPAARAATRMIVPRSCEPANSTTKKSNSTLADTSFAVAGLRDLWPARRLDEQRPQSFRDPWARCALARARLLTFTRPPSPAPR